MASNGPGWPPNNQPPPPPEQQPERQQRRLWRRPGPVSVAPVRLASLSGEHDVIGGGSDSGSPRQGDWRRQRQHRAEELFTHYEGERGRWQGAHFAAVGQQLGGPGHPPAICPPQPVALRGLLAAPAF